MSQKNHIAVLGAGPCGLYAARVLTRNGYSVTVLDKGERPGGLATSYQYGNNWYDMGVHMLHAFDQEVFEDVKGLMGEERIEVELNAKIKWANGHFRYPLQFQDMLKGIPILNLTHQVTALFASQIKNAIKPKTPKDAEEALIKLYGKPLYKFFFEDFTHRYWEIHPKNLSATFVTTKMPKLTAVDVIKKGLQTIGIKERVKTTESALTKETLHYSRTGAEAMPRRIAAAVTAAGGEIHQNVNVQKVHVEDSRVVGVTYENANGTHYLECDACVSTIPINHLAKAMQPLTPETILHSANQLRYKPIAIYGLLVRKQRCLDSLYVYYRNRIFHRVGEPKNGGLIVDPSDHTVLIVEMTCERDDPKWRGDETIRQQIFKELAEEEICQPEDVVEVHLTRSETGYPIFALGFEEHLDAIKKYLAQFNNLQSAGRQGAFTYPNMHSAMRMGWKAADKIIEYLSLGK